MKSCHTHFIFFLLSFFALKSEAQTSSFTFILPNPVCSPSAISFTNTSLGATQYTWEVNGPSTNFTQTVNNGAPFLFNFTNCGQFTVTLIASVGGVNPDTSSQNLFINCNPTPSYSVLDSTGCVGDCFTYNDNSLPGTGNITNVHWDFCDGNPQNGNSVMVCPAVAGCYCVQMTVTNSNGCVASINHTNALCVSTPPTVTIFDTVMGACNGPWDVQYWNTVGSNHPPFTFSWHFNGTANPANSTSSAPLVHYTSAGTYTSTLTVTDAYGCSSVTNYSVTIVGYTFNITSANIQSCTGSTDCIIANLSAIPTSLVWSTVPSAGVTIIDQGTSTPCFIFTNCGNYTLCGTATFAGGCVATSCTTFVKHGTPSINWNTTLSNNCSGPFTMTINNVVGNGGGCGANISSINWSFPNGNPSSGVGNGPFVITYPNAGCFSTIVTSVSDSGCSNIDTVVNCFPAVTACFTSTPQGSTCAPATYQFDASCSVGAPFTSFAWDFGDATTGNGQVVNHLYSSQGCYNVSVIMTTSAGCIDTAYDTVCVYSPIAACFTPNVDTVCVHEAVQFNLCSALPAGVTVCWNFGDTGSPFTCQAQAMNPSHQYNTFGCFDVTLIVNNHGCTDTFTMNNAVCTQPAVAVAVATHNCDSSLCVYFDGSTSIGANSYQWIFPNGVVTSNGTLTTPQVTACFPASGQYQYKLVVCNSTTLCCDTVTHNVLVRHVHAAFSTNGGSCAPSLVQLFNTSIDANVFRWYIYDSCGGAYSLVQTYNVKYPNTGSQPGNHLFTTPGFYKIKLVARDPFGCEDSVEHTITINGLITQFSTTPANGCAPLNVCFTNNTAASCTSNPVSCNWNFGDVASGALNTSNSCGNPCHVYNNGGNYNVTLVVIDDDGCHDSLTQSAAVVIPTAVACFTANDTTSCIGTNINFTNCSVGNALTYCWNFGDGIGCQSTQQNPVHSYGAAGNYTVQLIVTNASGCHDTLVKPAYIFISQPTANFTVDTSFTSCPPLTVHFTNTSNCTNPPCSYVWSFGAGQGASVVTNPIHTYQTPGVFYPSLTVTDGNGCTSSMIFDSIVVNGPFAVVTASVDSGCYPLNVTFNAVDTSAGISYQYFFGDTCCSITTFNHTVNHIYQHAGTFNAQVIVSDGICSYTINIANIVVDSIHVTINASPTSICSNGTTNFSATVSSTTTITNYSWNFGDPASGALNTSFNPTPSHNFTAVGNYTVTLTITTLTGCTGSSTIQISVTPPPVASFLPVPNPVCRWGTVQFVDNSVSSSPIISHQWNFGDPTSGASNFSNAGNPTHQYNTSGNFNIMMIVVAQNGCSDTITNSVTVNSNPVAVVAPSFSTCLHDSVQLTANGGLSCLWSPNLYLGNANNCTTKSSPPGNFVYQVIVTDINGCKDTASTNVTVHPLPPVSAGNDVSICQTGSVILNAGGATTYVWNTIPSGAPHNGSSWSVSPSATTTYFVTGTDGNSCVAKDTVVVTVNLNPVPVINGNDTICYGTSTVLCTSGGVTYSWSPTGGNAACATVAPLVNTTYSVTVTDANNCSGSSSIPIVVEPHPFVNAGTDQHVCTGAIANLAGFGNFASWHWSGPNLSSTSTQNTSALPSDTSVYQVIGIDQFGCSDTDWVNLYVLFPFTSVCPNDTIICSGHPVQLSSNGPPGSTYSWHPDNGSLNNPFIQNPVATPLNSANYFVIVYDGYCFHDTCSTFIDVNQSPTVNAGPDITISAGTHQLLNAIYSTNNGTYSWTPSNGLSCDNCPTPTASPAVNTTYTVMYTDNEGCTASDSLVIFVICDDAVIFVPDIFSPNHDGLNDVLFVRSNGLATLNYFRVFNRWGEKLFESNSYDIGWDGTRDARPVEPDVYIYWLDATCTNGQTIQLHGNVTVLK